MEAAKKRGPPKSYVEGLENRLMRMEKLLHKQFCPDADLSQELDGVLDKESWRAKGNNKVASSSATQGVVLPTIASTSLPVAVDVDDLDPSDEEISSGRHTLEHHMNRLKLDPGQPRFFGKSSSVMFLQNALDLKLCALGSRFSNDPRVLLDGIEDEHSAGWKWFRLVHWTRRSLLAAPRLYDLQIACLTAIFLNGSSTPQASWTVIGVGIRLAQDVGAHRRKVYNPVRTVEEELWKRAFWVLVYLDRFNSSALGRPCAIHDEDFDLDLPVECDDEYWIHEDPQLAFKQPPGKPSIVAYFNCSIRLNQILAFALRTIYSINKSKVLLGFVGQQWEQHIVAELDSALNKWIDSVPDHLRFSSIVPSYLPLENLHPYPTLPSQSALMPQDLVFTYLTCNINGATIHYLPINFNIAVR
ncbi:hypothetical protein EW026_g3253 [Hermanssonia centrifuga]|uniref:Xylanolytic transcriptional activator regulatory domain-containing protein n=1 Tax=Hermanssonia centrifuga TaxID=98765 RepID=A0A4S4KL93_9APHY|nr:hypothetical protein EW026_g3253 [Hermanssonia centrifuga]